MGYVIITMLLGSRTFDTLRDLLTTINKEKGLNGTVVFYEENHNIKKLYRLVDHNRKNHRYTITPFLIS